MKLAEKFDLPVVTLIDTPGAYPGIGAEERGQAECIARNLMEMSRLSTPIVSIVTGEGGSGGALGIGVADRVAMMEFAWYSVISPEACSAILFKGNEEAAATGREPEAHQQAPQAIRRHRRRRPRTARRRPPRPAHRRHNLEQFIAKTLGSLTRCKVENLLERRYERFRNLGVVADASRRHSGKAAG